MKHLFKATIVALIATVSIISLSSFISKKQVATATSGYIINLENTEMDANVSTSQVWTWKLYNPNPGNGSNGTLQNVSHWDLPLSAEAEAALISAEYSTDGGITWISVPLEIERDPSIRFCTGVDVLKFNVGTVGTQPNYYRIVFDQNFTVNPYATSYIKTGGGMKGCNTYYYAGVGGTKLD